MSTTSGIVLRIERFAIHDGPGIRTTVFLKGCPLRCSWCHSPESQSIRPEFMPLPDRCIACGLCVAACPEHAIAAPGAAAPAAACRLCRTCVDACPTGARLIAGASMDVASVLDAVERDRLFYDESGGGVTLSGGEPLMQPEFATALVDACRARALHVAVDTSGFGDPAALDRLWPDLFLFDVKVADDARHREITGVSNETVLANLARVASRRRKAFGKSPPRNRPTTTTASADRSVVGDAESRRDFPRDCDERVSDVIVRFPMIPGLNDDIANVHGLGRLVSSLRIDRVDVLPYHRAGIAKYARLGRPYPLPAVEPPSADEVARVVGILSGYGLTVRVGGS